MYQQRSSWIIQLPCWYTPVANRRISSVTLGSTIMRATTTQSCALQCPYVSQVTKYGVPKAIRAYAPALLRRRREGLFCYHFQRPIVLLFVFHRCTPRLRRVATRPRRLYVGRLLNRRRMRELRPLDRSRLPMYSLINVLSCMA